MGKNFRSAQIPLSMVGLPKLYDIPPREYLDKLKHSMQSLGQMLPIVVDENYKVFEGQGSQRVIVARELGWETIRATVVYETNI